MRAPVQTKRPALTSLLVLFLLLIPFTAQGAVIYVKATTSPPGDGLTWATAFPDLQDALAAAEAGDQIWVAGGTYHPSSIGDRSASFQMQAGVEMYGGFYGWETQLEERPDPNPPIYVYNLPKSYLSGQLTDTWYYYDENSYHVVRGADGAVLDGFHIEMGNADGDDLDACGGGMLNDGVSPIVRHCFFEGNQGETGAGVCNLGGAAGSFVDCYFEGNAATLGGGAANLDGAAVTFEDCEFYSNGADGGGAVYGAGEVGYVYEGCAFYYNNAWDGASVQCEGSTGTFNRCEFNYGYASNQGGALWFGDGSSSSLVNCFLWWNSAGREGGAIAASGLSQLTLMNCTLAANRAESGAATSADNSTVTMTNGLVGDNTATREPEAILQVLNAGEIQATYSAIQGGYPGTGNIALSSSPYYYYPYEYLYGGEPWIDAGTVSGAPETDIDGNPRHDDLGMPNTGDGPPWVDMGAFEFQGTSPFVELVYPNDSGIALNRGEECLIEWNALGMEYPWGGYRHLYVWLIDSEGNRWPLAYLLADKTQLRWRVGDWKKRIPVAWSSWDTDYDKYSTGYPDGAEYKIHISEWSYATTTSVPFDAIWSSEEPFTIRSPASVEIVGPTEVSENGLAQYECLIHYTEGDPATATGGVKWKCSGGGGKINKTTGLLTTKEVKSDRPCTIRATVGKGKYGVTGELPITVVDVP